MRKGTELFPTPQQEKHSQSGNENCTEEEFFKLFQGFPVIIHPDTIQESQVDGKPFFPLHCNAIEIV